MAVCLWVALLPAGKRGYPILKDHGLTQIAQINADYTDVKIVVIGLRMFERLAATVVWFLCSQAGAEGLTIM